MAWRALRRLRPFVLRFNPDYGTAQRPSLQILEDIASSKIYGIVAPLNGNQYR
jgi:hypothetical protein